MSEMQRVLASLDLAAASRSTERIDAELYADAARLLREMAADFDEYADHGLSKIGGCPRALLDADFAAKYGKACTCGLYAAREKWRLEP